MISQDFLDMLRCPLDPSHTRLDLDNDRLVCQRCRLRFKIKDGFPVLIVDDAELPAGCAAISQLPCQRDKKV